MDGQGFEHPKWIGQEALNSLGVLAMTTQRNPIDSRCFRAESWIDKAENSNEEDLDAKFIFCWIAFNALYGQPKYLSHRKGSEWDDIDKFLACLTALDAVGQIQTACNSDSLRGIIYDLTMDHYLNDGCWVGWYERDVDELVLREKYAYPYQRKGRDLTQLFSQIYVLRKQVFHGCSASKSSKNRETLRRSVAVLRKLIPIFIKVVRVNANDEHLKALLQDLPYPPTKGGTG